MEVVILTKYTVIVQMPCGELNVGVTNNISCYMKQQRSKTHNGYFHQKRNLGSAKVVFCVKGDYKDSIKRFPTRAFITMLKIYDPLDDAINQILN